jgi:hypothetical protein
MQIERRESDMLRKEESRAKQAEMERSHLKI